MSERELLHREFHVEITGDGDGRTIEARCVPYNEPAVVADPPRWEPYREMFLAGAFRSQVRAADRVKVWLNFEHEPGLRGIVGHGLELDERQDGLYGRFRVHANPDGEKALHLIREGLLTGLSMEFDAIRSIRRNGIVERVKAHVDRVSLVRIGAYENARVLALRKPPRPRAARLELPAFDPALAARVAQHGIVVPDTLA